MTVDTWERGDPRRPLNGESGQDTAASKHTGGNLVGADPRRRPPAGTRPDSSGTAETCDELSGVTAPAHARRAGGMAYLVACSAPRSVALAG